MRSRRRKNTGFPFWIGVALAIGVFIGAKYGEFGKFGRVDNSGKLDAVLNYIYKSYVDTVNIPRLIENALPHIIQELDPHSEYITAEQMKRVNEDLEGHFSGIGVSFYVLKDTIVVTQIVPGGPSEAAGIMPWDRIVTVDDSLVAGRQIQNEEVLKTLRGERGTEVTLGIRRGDEPGLIDITVTRGDIPMSSVNATYMLTDAIGYIKLGRNFGFNTFSEFINAISKLKSRGATALVIDLRGNVGGSLASSPVTTVAATTLRTVASSCGLSEYSRVSLLSNSNDVSSSILKSCSRVSFLFTYPLYNTRNASTSLA